MRSAGSEPAETLNPAVVETIAEVGMDLSGASPKSLAGHATRAADVIITMVCGNACTIYPGQRYLDWELEDPAGKTSSGSAPSATEIDRKVKVLVAELLAEPR